MPKRVLIVLALAVLAVAACSGSSSSTTPNPSGSPVSPAPNPSITTAHLQVTILGSPAAQVPVEESTPANKISPRPGTPFDVMKTGKLGKVKFTGLKPAKTYCWVAVIAPGQQYSQCADWELWQSSTISLGT